MEKGIIDVKLLYKPVVDGGNRKYGSDSHHLSNWCKCLYVVNAFLLSKGCWEIEVDGEGWGIKGPEEVVWDGEVALVGDALGVVGVEEVFDVSMVTVGNAVSY
ncbi:hypothetical protein Tco_0798302 [Tanacetum coccineum]